MFKVNTNTAADIAHNAGVSNNKALSSSLEKLSSGLRINRAADDSSGMQISNMLRNQAESLGQAIMNANDGVGIMQIADKAMDEQVKILDQIKVKATQAAQDGQSSDSRLAIQKDINRLLSALQDIATTTSYNGMQLLSGTFTNKEFQVGATSNTTIKASIGDTRISKIGQVRIETGSNITSSSELDGLEINGVEIQSTVISTSVGTGVGALAATINRDSDTIGVKASYVTQSTGDDAIVAGDVTNLTINGVTIGDIQDVEDNDKDGRLVNAINAIKETTGVEASRDSQGRLVLNSADGRGVKVTADSGLSAVMQMAEGDTTYSLTAAADLAAGTNSGTGTFEITDADGTTHTLTFGAFTGADTTDEASIQSVLDTAGLSITASVSSSRLTLSSSEDFSIGTASAATSTMGFTGVEGNMTLESSYESAGDDFSGVVAGETFEINGTTVTLTGNLADANGDADIAAGNASVIQDSIDAISDLESLDLTVTVTNTSKITITSGAGTSFVITDSAGDGFADDTNTFYNNTMFDSIGTTSTITAGSEHENYGRLTLTRLDARDIEVDYSGTLSTAQGFSSASLDDTAKAEELVQMLGFQAVEDITAGADTTITDTAGNSLTVQKLENKIVGESVATLNLEDVMGGFDMEMANAIGAHANTNDGYLDTADTGVTTLKGAMVVMDIAESAIKSLDNTRSDIGSIQNQFNTTISNISVTRINVQAAESQIRDVDFALESSNFSKLNILAQSGSYALSQANLLQKNITRLLQ